MATKPTAAIDRIRAANGDAYDATNNPGGLAQGGHRQNFVPDLNAVVDVGLYVETLSDETADNVAEIEAAIPEIREARTEVANNRTAAANSATAAANSAAGVNLPAVNSADAGKVLTVKTDGTGYEPKLIDVPAIKPITMTSPTAGATNIGNGGSYTFVVQAFSGDTTGFYSDYGIPLATRFVRAYEPGGTTPVATFSFTGASASFVVNFASSGLSTSHTYEFQAGYTDALSATVLSQRVNATTAALFRPVPGSQFGGGTFVGQISRGGVTYDQIAAPRSSGETTLQYSTDGNSPGFSDRSNGKSITETALTNAKYAAARWADALTIAGYSDWFVPAEDQLELGYRNLKPTATANNTSSGANANSVPTGAAYTSSVPGQTAVAAFQSGGAEAFSTAQYWSTTSNDGVNAIAQDFGTGNQSAVSVSTSLKVRAWREQPV